MHVRHTQSTVSVTLMDREKGIHLKRQKDRSWQLLVCEDSGDVEESWHVRFKPDGHIGGASSARGTLSMIALKYG